jgi:hypothetical protein
MTTENLDLNLTLIKRKIRWGHEPDNPMLIKLWLSLEEQVIVNQVEIKLKRSLYEAQFHLLLKTIEDELISKVWRHVCLDNIYQPLRSLHKLTDNAASISRLRTLSSSLAFIGHRDLSL